MVRISRIAPKILHTTNLQAEEAQRLRRKRKADRMRLLDMQRRQMKRLEEVRETQKKVFVYTYACYILSCSSAFWFLAIDFNHHAMLGRGNVLIFVFPKYTPD